MRRLMGRRMLLLATILVGACAAQMSESEKQEASQPHYDIGLGALAENNMSKAIAELKEAIEIAPNNPRYRHALGNAYLRANQPEQAVQAFRIAVELDPNFSDAYNDLGAAYLRQQQWDPAIGAFRKALANPRYLNPERAYMNLGSVYMMQRQYVLAAEQFRKLADVLPQSPDGYFLLGRALAEQGKTAEARDQFEKAIKLDGTIAIFHLEMGVVQIREGDKAAAAESLRRVIELSPSGPEATEARRRLQGLN